MKVSEIIQRIVDSRQLQVDSCRCVHFLIVCVTLFYMNTISLIEEYTEMLKQQILVDSALQIIVCINHKKQLVNKKIKTEEDV